MPVLVRLTALLLTLAALGACFVGTSAQRARRQGQNQARQDLAEGRAFLRVMDHRSDVYAFVDVSTGLPTQDWSLHCGTGVDFAAYEARIEGYNDVVRDALANGELDARLLSHKLRTRERAEAQFRAATPHDWSAGEPACDPGTGPYRVEFRPHPQYSSPVAHVVERGSGAAWEFTCFESSEAGTSFAFVDDGTTLLVRRADGAFLTWDLVTGCALQLIAPPSPDPADK